MNWNDAPGPAAAPSKLGWLLGVAACLGLGLLFFSLWRPAPTEPLRPVGPRHPSVLAKSKVEDLEFQPLIAAGEEPITSQNFQGKVTLINFWGYWCPPCRVEFPHMVALRKEFAANQDFQFVSVAVMSEPGDTDILRMNSEAYLKSEGYQLPVHHDPDFNSLRKIILQTKISPSDLAFPSTLVLDRTGNLAGFWIGYVPGWEKEMVQVVQDTLTTGK